MGWARALCLCMALGCGNSASNNATTGGPNNNGRRLLLSDFTTGTSVKFASTPRVTPTSGGACPANFPVGCGASCCPTGATCANGMCMFAIVERQCTSAETVCGSGCCLAGAICVDNRSCGHAPMPITCTDAANPVNCGPYCCPTGATCGNTSSDECILAPDSGACASPSPVPCGAGTCCPPGGTCNASQQCSKESTFRPCLGPECVTGCCNTGATSRDSCISGVCVNNKSSAPSPSPCVDPSATPCTTTYCAPSGVDCADCTDAGCTVSGMSGSAPPGTVTPCAGGGCPADAPDCASGDAHPDGVCCPSGQDTICGDNCCESGATCNGGECGCPAGDTLCGDFCCGAGTSCVNGQCVCNPPEVTCGSVCCGQGTVCAGDHCECPGDHPGTCGDFCCLPGAPCMNGGQDCGCPSGTKQCDGANSCCMVVTPPCDTSAGNALAPCPDGTMQCCSIHMVCCHDSANGGAIGCEFTGFCQ